MTTKRTPEEAHALVTTDYERERGEHPIGKVCHISTVTHAWRGVLREVTPSYYVLDSAHPVALVDSTGEMRAYVKAFKGGSEGDSFVSTKTIRILRGAVSWMVSE